MMVNSMAKKVRLIFASFLGIIIITILSLVVVHILNDENKLTVEENKWINNNLSTVLNVNVINDLDIFGNGGTGIFYDFLNDFNIINTITFDDHHHYIPTDIIDIPGNIITTEKDAVKLERFERDNIYALKLKTKIDVKELLK